MGTPKEDIKEGIDQALIFLRAGGVVVFPTDTLYGLGADVFSANAVERIFQIKLRPAGLALPVLVSSWEQALSVTRGAPDLARKLAHKLAGRFWPGPLTLVLPKSESLPPGVIGGMDTVAVRMPNHPVALELIKKLGRPITGTSANRSGEQDLSTIDDVIADLGNDVDYIIKAGPAPVGASSTVVDVTTDTIRLIRQGALPFQDILEAAGFEG